MRALAIVTSLWAIVMALSPGLQIRAMLRTRSSQDVSIGYFAVLVIGFCLWVAYGIGKGDPVLYIPNSVAALIGSGTIVVALWFRRKAKATN